MEGQRRLSILFNQTRGFAREDILKSNGTYFRGYDQPRISPNLVSQRQPIRRPLPTYLIMTLRLSTILSSHLNCKRIGLLNRRVMAPTPAMVMSTSIPDKNRAAGKEKQG